MKKHLQVLLIAAILLMAFALPAAAQGTDFSVPADAAASVMNDKAEASLYIVRLIDNPVVGYEGDITGFKATKPGNGERVNPNSGKVKKYVNYLNNSHNAALAAVGVDKTNKVYDYVYSFNGFAAILTPAEAAGMASLGNVLSVEADVLVPLNSDRSPGYLGLSDPGGLWDQLGGVESAGEDIIIGIIDTGIWPEHPSFSDQDDFANRTGESGKATRVYGPAPAHWNGTCQSGEQWSQDDCNNKLIGARYFLDGFGQYGIIADDYKSARDADGHGSHTAATAGGNYGVPASILGADLGTVSGMAPRARIAMYKACWNDAGCSGTDLVAAIDQAVADGVDVINYSIGSSVPSLLGADDVAFLFAADAGVFVATSNGNAGPGAETVGSPASIPWVTSVGASTHDRTFEGTAFLGDGASVTGASLTGGTAVLTIVDSVDAGSELCIPGELDPNVVAGNIVLCKRGAIARIGKSQAVQIAGGAGMILYNASNGDSQVTDNHYVPSIHTNNTDGLIVKAYIALEGANATAQLGGGSVVYGGGSSMAAFSSRGPNGASYDVIKPDVTAPGVNILAAGSPTPIFGVQGENFMAISGTSMSSPHVAGLGALLAQAHPDWSPAMIKSALMTSSRQNVTKEDGSTQADPFDMGAGYVQPNPATDPGLVYDAGFVDYLGFLCGTGELNASYCPFIGFDPSDLNLASIAVGDLAGAQTVTRTVTNVGAAGTYNVSVDAPAGVNVSVNPAVLNLGAGDSASYTVTFTNVSAPSFAWAFGSLTWDDGTHSVYSPIALRPVPIAAPNSVSGAGTSGSDNFDVTFGANGDFNAAARGLAAADAQAGTVIDDPSNDINTALGNGVGITVHAVNIPAGTEYARFSLFDADTDGADDLDLYVFGPLGFVGGSGSGTSAEEVNTVAPVAGTYFVVVHGWQTDGADSNYTLFSWAIGSGNAGNFSVAGPNAAVIGATGNISFSWNGLTAGTRYLGAITYHSALAPANWNDALIDFTIVSIDG